MALVEISRGTADKRKAGRPKGSTKPKRGRPRKQLQFLQGSSTHEQNAVETTALTFPPTNDDQSSRLDIPFKRKAGRPPGTTKKKRGRPPKQRPELTPLSEWSDTTISSSASCSTSQLSNMTDSNCYSSPDPAESQSLTSTPFAMSLLTLSPLAMHISTEHSYASVDTDRLAVPTLPVSRRLVYDQEASMDIRSPGLQQTKSLSDTSSCTVSVTSSPSTASTTPFVTSTPMDISSKDISSSALAEATLLFGTLPVTPSANSQPSAINTMPSATMTSADISSPELAEVTLPSCTPPVTPSLNSRPSVTNTKAPATTTSADISSPVLVDVTFSSGTPPVTPSLASRPSATNTMPSAITTSADISSPVLAEVTLPSGTPPVTPSLTSQPSATNTTLSATTTSGDICSPMLAEVTLPSSTLPVMPSLTSQLSAANTMPFATLTSADISTPVLTETTLPSGPLPIPLSVTSRPYSTNTTPFPTSMPASFTNTLPYTTQLSVDADSPVLAEAISHANVPPITSISEEPISTPLQSVYEQLRSHVHEIGAYGDFRPYHVLDCPEIKFAELYNGENSDTKLTVRIDTDFTASVKVHQRDIVESHALWIGMPTTYGTVSDIKILLKKIQTFSVCVGNYDEEMQHIVPVGAEISEKGKIIKAFHEHNFGASNGQHQYSSTIRTKACEMLYEGVRCKRCQGYRARLQNVLSRERLAALNPKQPQSSLSSKKADVWKTNEELRTKIHELQQKNKDLETELRQKDREIRQLIKQQGTHLHENDANDFKQLMKKLTPKVRHAYKDHDSFQRIFWEQQLQLMSLSSSSSVRWHPAIIKWCLYLKSRSSKAYHAMRSTGFIKLPSERTLFDYSHALPSKTSYQPEYAEKLIQEAEDMGMYSEEHKSFVGILHDEIKIKEDLVYDRTTGELVGFIDLDKYGNTVLDLEENLKDSEKRVATHALIVMVRGITSDLRFPLAVFATNGITSDLLYNVVWGAVEILETVCDLKVLFVTCDGASPNRRFFRINYIGDGDSRVGYWTINRFADDGRKLFFISDVPHLLKTIRNCFANSGAHSRSRLLWKDGKEISWLHIVRYYEEHVVGKVLNQANKLTDAHVHLTAFSKMKVNLAAQVMSNHVPEALEDNYGVEVSESVELLRKVNKFFGCLNTRSKHEGNRKRNENLNVYRSVEDDRLMYLTDEFLEYFKQWEQSIEAEFGHLEKKDKAKMMLSHQTLNGLSITVNAIVECTRFLLVNGVEYVITNRFNQDPLEAHFSHYRHKGGANDNPTMYQVKNTMSGLMVVGSAAIDPMRGGNVKRRAQSNLDITDRPLPKRKS